MKQCINFDWLELYCIEDPITGSLDPGRLDGYDIRVREYGTPQYAQMYTIFVEGQPWLEVRRQPYSTKPEGGIMEPGACHIRLCNMWCYVPRAVQSIRDFLLAHSVEFVNISRVDLCADFTAFNGDVTDVQAFIQAYMAGDFFKEFQPRVRAICDKVLKGLHRTTISAFGTDLPHERIWNSLSWGSTLSFVKTRLYNKTYEMQCERPKNYIKSLWRKCGWNGTDTVWRLEFEIKANSSFLNSVDGQNYKLGLEHLEDVEERALWFHSFAMRYFRFRKREFTSKGTVQRKDRSTVVLPLRYFATDMNLKPFQPDIRRDPVSKEYKAFEVLTRLEDELPAQLLTHCFRLKEWLFARTSVETAVR